MDSSSFMIKFDGSSLTIKSAQNSLRAAFAILKVNGLKLHCLKFMFK